MFIKQLQLKLWQIVKTSNRNLTSNHGKELNDLVQSITVHTCKDLYPKLNKLYPKLYKSTNKNGLNISVKYVDTANDPTKSKDDKFKQVIVAIPGAAGNYTHFDQLINHYRNTNVRVIVPNFPDFGHTRSLGRIFLHSNEERTAFMKDFLSQIKVDKIDCLVGHSFGMHTMLDLFQEDVNVQINSLVFFAPQPLYDMNERQAKIGKLILFGNNSELWYRWLSFIRIYKVKFIKAKFNNLNDFLTFMAPALHQQSLAQLPNVIKNLISKYEKMQIAIMYGDKDVFITPRSKLKLLLDFGIREEDIVYIDTKTDLPSVKINPKGQRITAYYIKDAGHFAYANHSQFSMPIIQNLLDNVKDQ